MLPCLGNKIDIKKKKIKYLFANGFRVTKSAGKPFDKNWKDVLHCSDSHN